MITFGPDRVVLDMPREMYGELLLLLGYAMAKSEEDDVLNRRRFLLFLNALNDGNPDPDYTPYEIPPEAKP
jgi:hypothetical protein